MIKRIAFLLLTFLILGTAASAVPTAALSANPASGHSPLQVTFSASCSDDNAATPIVSCTITMGDGNAATDFNGVSGGLHTYQSRGTFDANLFALNSKGQSDDAVVQISVLNNYPTVTFYVNPDNGNTPLAVTFTGFCSDADGNADIVSCKINFGDGNSAIDFVSPTVHTYYATKIATLTAIDTNGAIADNNEAIVVSAAAAPTIGNKKPSNGSYTNSVRPTVSFDVNGSASGVDISKLALFVDGSPVTPNVPIQFGNNYFVSRQYGSDLSNGYNAKIGVRAFDNLGNYADANWSFTIDTASPSSISISFGSGWTNSETPAFSLSASDSGSGMGSGAEMRFSCNNSSWASPVAYATSYSGFNITTATGVGCNSSDGTKTIYAQFKDVAGNWNSSSASTSVNYDNSNPSKPNAPSATAGNGQVSLSWSSTSDNGPAGVDTYKIYMNGSYNSSTTSTSKTITGLSNGSSYGFRVAAVDRAGNESEWSNSVSATPTSSGSSSSGNSTACANDTSEPWLEWEFPAVNSTVSGIVRLKVHAYDDECGLRFVDFRVNNVSIGSDSTASSERYTFDWNSETVVDGTHVLKATAKSFNGDEEYNSINRTLIVKTSNGVTKVYVQPVADGDRAAAQSAIDSAEGAKDDVDAVVAELASLGVLPGEAAGELISDALDLLDEANAFFNDAEYADAAVKADDAMEKFEEAVGMLAVEDYDETGDYVFNEEHLGIMLKGLGFSQQLIDEAEQLLQENAVSRSLSFKKVEDGDATYYKAVITLVVKNNSGEAMDAKVIEIVPKELAASASDLAGSGFTVLADDPVLEWAVSLDGAGEEKEIVYSLKSELTAEEADAMVASGIINKFAAPPVLLKAGTNVGAMFLPATAGLFGLGGTVEIVGVAIIIGAIVVFAVLYVAGRRGRSEGGSALDAAASRAGFGPGFFDRLGKKKEGHSGPKWRYKGV